MSRVTEKYQITIPLKVRREIGIVPGSEVDIVRRSDKYVLVVNPVIEVKKKWRGKFKGGKTTDEYMNEVRGKVN